MSSPNPNVPVVSPSIASNTMFLPFPATIQQQFSQLWNLHLGHLAHGKVIYYVPKNMGERVGFARLKQFADQIQLV